MFFIYSSTAIRSKYATATDKILAAITRLGTTVDVSASPPEQIQQHIAKLPAGPVCLVGGYDLIPPFMRANPTYGAHDDDVDIPTDAPYGATPGTPAEEYAPQRAISRIPDSALPDATEFLTLLDYQFVAPTTPTPAGSFEEAADEFSGAQDYVHASIPGTSAAPLLSPPSNGSAAALTSQLSRRGRFHILLHGANRDPDWTFLWGHSSTPNATYIKALSAQLFDLCDLRGAVVSFSSCYAAMLDTAPATHGTRTTRNQVSLACLSHGAKVAYGSTRSNWIDTMAPFDGFGPGLIAQVWRQLAKGVQAAEALRLAKSAYLKVALSGSPADRPYALKTVLQAQCYGHPGATL